MRPQEATGLGIALSISHLLFPVLPSHLSSLSSWWQGGCQKRLDLSPTLSAARAESEHLFFPTVSTKVPGLSPLGAEWAWRYGLSVKWPPYVHLFEHLVPSWATLSRVEPLGDGASLEEAGQWGGGRALGLQPDPSSCPVSASCSTEM